MLNNKSGKRKETPLILDVLILANKGYTTAEIAKMLNTTERKVVSILNRRWEFLSVGGVSSASYFLQYSIFLQHNQFIF